MGNPKERCFLWQRYVNKPAIQRYGRYLIPALKKEPIKKEVLDITIGTFIMEPDFKIYNYKSDDT